MKTCSICNEVKESEAFPKHRRWCKTCHSEKSKVYYENNRDKLRAASAKYRENNLDKVKAAIVKWQKENPDKVKVAIVKWLKENPDRKKAANVKWRKENPDKERAQAARYVKELREGYLVETLKKQGFSKDQITPEIIEIKRVLLKTKRLCKTLNS